MFKPVKNMKVYEQVVDQIKEMVRVGQIKKKEISFLQRELWQKSFK